MNTQENNKLIAFFNGDIKTINNKVSLKKNCSVDDLQYHKDWNWLMPVIKKILDISLNLDTMEMYYNITDCIPNITQTHIAVIDFIKWYNKQK